MTEQAISPLRRRMIEAMSIRKLAPKTPRFLADLPTRPSRRMCVAFELRFSGRIERSRPCPQSQVIKNSFVVDYFTSILRKALRVCDISYKES
jgi:hypothetical protein